MAKNSVTVVNCISLFDFRLGSIFTYIYSISSVDVRVSYVRMQVRGFNKEKKRQTKK